MSTQKRLPSYAIWHFDQWAAALFDKSLLGMVRVGPDRKIEAWNATAARTLGLDSLENRSVEELLADRESFDTLNTQGQQRREGVTSEFVINLLHFPDKRSVPVRVSAMPMILETGEFAGTFAIVQNLEAERRIAAFEEAILSAHGTSEIFQAVCQQLRPLLNFDFAAFSIFGKSGKHSRMLLTYDPEGQVDNHRRWYPMCGALAAWSQQQEVQVIELADFVRQFAEFKDDATVKRFLSAGLVKTLRFPVVRGGRVVASFSCSSRDPAAFGQREKEIACALPIAKAFLIALHSLENDDLSFRINLIREMFICRTQEEIADVAAKRIAEQYGWESVEIYTIEEASRRVRLLSQCSTPEYAADEGYSQSIDKGVLGYVCRTDQDVRIDNVLRDSKFGGSFLRTSRETLSELCMPIRVNGRIAGLLNVEDKHENAFSEEEQEMLRSLLDEIGGLFGAVWNKALIASAFEQTPSMVLIADTSRTVIQHNAAVVTALGFSPQEVMGSAVSRFFEPEIVDRLFQSPLAGIESAMRRKDGTTLPVLLGSRELEGFGAWVISARDISAQKRIAELESLRHMYREIAAQTKTPLSLAYSWVHRLERQLRDSQNGTAAILRKTLAQLKKVDITYERLALYSQGNADRAAKELLLNAGDLLRRITDNLPEGLLSIEGLEERPFYIRGDPYEIEFAVESTISYLERFLAPDEKVSVRLQSAGGRLSVEIEGGFPPEPESCIIGEASDAAPEDVCRALHEMSLGAEIIGKVMQQHGGEFHQDSLENDKVRFRLDFPLVNVGAFHA